MGSMILFRVRRCLFHSIFFTMQLSGDSGKAILGTIANITTNQTNSTNETDGGLWRWGKVPVGHLVNTSGNLVMVLPP
jgi:hypothetical protein